MHKLFVLAIALTLAGACSKKDDKSATAGAGSGSAAVTPTEAPKTADPGSAAPAGSAEPAGSADPGSAAAAGDATIPELKALPAGMHKDCEAAYENMKKLHACEKLEAKMRADMVKSWNTAVTGSFEVYGKASASQKETIDGTCTSMNKSFAMLINGC